ncbi:MAG TPA: flagellar basal body-associated FliL family protein [Fimbriimonas sp.]|nr:flagellar basal body-associated FliL family protein [Fimbriimonas sp.]
MSEEAVESPKKKKPIMPILMVLVLLLLGGGFFMMKSKSGKPDKKAKIELAEKDTELEEFLTNTADPSVYVRAKISVTLRKDFEEAKFKAETGDVRDAVLLVFNRTQPREVTDGSNRKHLKRELADAMNEALNAADEKDKDPEAKPERPKPLDLKSDRDSSTGPVMKVRFSSLATQ